jgi:hypothetical protein
MQTAPDNGYGHMKKSRNTQNLKLGKGKKLWKFIQISGCGSVPIRPHPTSTGLQVPSETWSCADNYPIGNFVAASFFLRMRSICWKIEVRA